MSDQIQLPSNPLVAPPLDAPASWRRRPHATDVNLWGSFLAGGALSAAFYYGLVMRVPGTRFGQIFLNRGWVTKMEAFLASWAICIMLLKAWQVMREHAHTARQTIPEEIAAIDEPKTAAAALLLLDRADPGHARGILRRRMRAAVAHYRTHPTRAAVTEFLDSLALIDANRAESTYAMLRVIVWAIPIVGFIGTVVGLGTAVGGFSESLPKATDFIQLKGLLSGVTSGLSVAFDATFVALLISLLLMFPASVLEKWEQDMLSDVDEFCQHSLLQWFAERTRSSDEELQNFGRHLEATLRSQQQAFLDWWKTLNGELAERLQGASETVHAVTRAVCASAESLQGAVAAAASHASGMPEMLAQAAGHANSVLAALTTSRSAARNITESFDQARLNMTASLEAAASLKLQVCGARDAGRQLRTDLEQAIAATAESYFDEMSLRLEEFKSHAAAMHTAADSLRTLAARRPNGHLEAADRQG